MAGPSSGGVDLLTRRRPDGPAAAPARHGEPEPLPRLGPSDPRGHADLRVIVADNGSPWFISGVPDARWDNDALHTLGGLKGSDFDALGASAMQVSPDSGQAQPS